MRRWVVLAIALLVLPAGQVFASDATPAPVVVASPTAEGCDRLGPYLADLNDVMDAVAAQLKERFPNRLPPREGSDDPATDFLLGASPDELRAFAEIMDRAVVSFEAIDVPPVAQAFHREYMQGVRLSANALREASTIGLFMAFLMYEDVIDESEARQDALAQAALAVCPAFQRVIDFYDDDNPIATPAASPAR